VAGDVGEIAGRRCPLQVRRREAVELDADEAALLPGRAARQALLAERVGLAAVVDPEEAVEQVGPGHRCASRKFSASISYDWRNMSFGVCD